MQWTHLECCKQLGVVPKRGAGKGPREADYASLLRLLSLKMSAASGGKSQEKRVRRSCAGVGSEWTPPRLPTPGTAVICGIGVRISL